VHTIARITIAALMSLPARVCCWACAVSMGYLTP
jgi:hypothetical protein